MFYREQLETIHKSLEELLADLRREEQGLPEGSLLVYEKKGHRYYCQRFPREGNRKKEHRVSITKDSDMVLALVRKKYVSTAIINAEKDLAALGGLMKNYDPISEEEVMRSFCSKYPELKNGLVYGLANAEEWEASHVQQKDFYAEDLKSVSSQGEDMRSGGEMYISSRLDHYGIPYRYEAPLNIPDLPYRPDFTIMRPRDREIIYWEHFGKINDYDYVRNSITKVRDYIEYGIKPWDNLIITYNNEKGGFNGKMIDAMIECWLL